MLDYAPLFRQLKGKVWAGDAHAVMVVGGGLAQANVFEIEEKGAAAAAGVRVLVVAFGPTNGMVSVALRAAAYSAATVFRPGAGPAGMRLPSAPTTAGGVTTVAVPMSSGTPACAVVRLTPKA